MVNETQPLPSGSLEPRVGGEGTEITANGMYVEVPSAEEGSSEKHWPISGLYASLPCALNM